MDLQIPTNFIWYMYGSKLLCQVSAPRVKSCGVMVVTLTVLTTACKYTRRVDVMSEHNVACLDG